MQTRADWLRWRKGGIGSSDIAAIIGVSSYKTALQVYEDKVDPEIREETSWIMEEGNKIEPRLRSYFELQVEESYQALNAEMEQFPFLRCSLDGKSECGKKGLEIKLVGKEDFAAGVVPKKYVPQTQWQMLICNLEKHSLLMYQHTPGKNHETLDSTKIKTIDVIPDKNYQTMLLEEGIKFWTEHVLKRKPPTSIDKDFAPLVGYAETANKWKDTKAQIEKLEEQLERIREDLLTAAEKTNSNRILCAGLRITKESRQGSVDYSKIEALKGMDLNPYRKAGTTYWKIEPMKEIRSEKSK